MEVYIYRGKEGEKVPENVEKLIVDEGVQELPESLCDTRYQCLLEVSLPYGLIKIGNWAFLFCDQLLEINIFSTSQYIGTRGPSSLHHMLQEIDQAAFKHCTSLPRIKLPSSVTSVGKYAFKSCNALVEANLSATTITEIARSSFSACSSLQTVILPNTLEGIGHLAFGRCQELVTVVVPLGSKSIRIGGKSFKLCSRLANFLLPQDSTAEENSFEGCTLLYERYGEDSSRILAGLMGRFQNYPIHKMCYDHSETIAQKMRQRIGDQQEWNSLLDEFGMTPFHVFFSTIEPSIELLDVLLEYLPCQILKLKDANGKRPLDYLVNNYWADRASKRLLQKTLPKWMIDRVACWGVESWVKDMQSKVQDVLSEDGKEQRITLYNDANTAFERYENVELTSILEMTLWKGKLKSGSISDGTNREKCRYLSGPDVVIPSIATFLDMPRRND